MNEYLERLQSFYELCSLVLNLSYSDDLNAPWTPLFELAHELHELIRCSVCGNMIVKPFEFISSNCKHTVCDVCVVHVTRVCPSCVPSQTRVEEYMALKVILSGYICLCKYIRCCNFFRCSVLNNITEDKLRFLAQVTEISILNLECPITNRTSVFNSNSFAHGSSSIDPSQPSTSRCQTSNNIFTKSGTKSIKRKCQTAPNRHPKKLIGDQTDVTFNSECESNQDICNQGSKDKICTPRSVNSSTCLHPNSLSSNMITSEDCRKTLSPRRATPRPQSSSIRKSQKAKKYARKNIVSEETCIPTPIHIQDPHSPFIVFNTFELKKLEYCNCDSINDPSFPTTCYEMNCPCYLNDKACGSDCKCHDCVNPNIPKTTSSQDAIECVSDKTDELDCSKASCSNCKQLVKFNKGTIKNAFKNKPTASTSFGQSIVSTSAGQSAASSSCSQSAASSSVGQRTSCASLGQKMDLDTAVSIVDSYIGKIFDKPPLVNHHNCPNNIELFDFSRANIVKYLYQDRGRDDKPGCIHPHPSNRKCKTCEPNAELIRRAYELCKKSNDLAVINPKLLAYYINQNQALTPGHPSGMRTTVDELLAPVEHHNHDSSICIPFL